MVRAPRRLRAVPAGPPDPRLCRLPLVSIGAGSRVQTSRRPSTASITRATAGRAFLVRPVGPRSDSVEPPVSIATYWGLALRHLLGQSNGQVGGEQGREEAPDGDEGVPERQGG